jgi:hypothetical protein
LVGDPAEQHVSISSVLIHDGLCRPGIPPDAEAVLAIPGKNLARPGDLSAEDRGGESVGMQRQALAQWQMALAL